MTGHTTHRIQKHNITTTPSDRRLPSSGAPSHTRPPPSVPQPPLQPVSESSGARQIALYQPRHLLETGAHSTVKSGVDTTTQTNKTARGFRHRLENGMAVGIGAGEPGKSQCMGDKCRKSQRYRTDVRTKVFIKRDYSSRERRPSAVERTGQSTHGSPQNIFNGRYAIGSL